MTLENDSTFKRIRGFALSIMGSFVFALSSVIIVAVRAQPTYLIVGSLSLFSVALAYFATHSHTALRQVTYLLSTGGALAAEVSLAVFYFPQTEASLYSLVTLVGSCLALKGIRDIEDHASPYYPRQRGLDVVKEEMR